MKKTLRTMAGAAILLAGASTLALAQTPGYAYQPGYGGAPAYGQPAYGQPAYGQPPAGSRPMGSPPIINCVQRRRPEPSSAARRRRRHRATAAARGGVGAAPVRRWAQSPAAQPAYGAPAYGGTYPPPAPATSGRYGTTSPATTIRTPASRSGQLRVPGSCSENQIGGSPMRWKLVAAAFALAAATTRRHSPRTEFRLEPRQRRDQPACDRVQRHQGDPDYSGTSRPPTCGITGRRRATHARRRMLGGPTYAPVAPGGAPLVLHSRTPLGLVSRRQSSGSARPRCPG
jgi:hypothetical protein